MSQMVEEETLKSKVEIGEMTLISGGGNVNLDFYSIYQMTMNSS
jgi:hypothetical protein